MILDTCALLWLAAGDYKKLSENALNQVNNAPTVSVVAITAFEIALQHRVGKLILPVEPRQWFTMVVAHHHIDVIDLDGDICIRAVELPQIHKDPCDRFIIAAALIKNLPIVTADKQFAQYGVTVVS